MVDTDASVSVITRQSDVGLDILRHDCAHVLAEAVQALYPGTQITFGPSIDNGFYYDFYRETPFSTNDFEKIEQKMHAIIKRDARSKDRYGNGQMPIGIFSTRAKYLRRNMCSLCRRMWKFLCIGKGSGSICVGGYTPHRPVILAMGLN